MSMDSPGNGAGSCSFSPTLSLAANEGTKVTESQTPGANDFTTKDSFGVRGSSNSIRKPGRLSLPSVATGETAATTAKDTKQKQVFVDAAAMKEKVRQNLTKRKVVVSDYYRTTGIWHEIARHPKFENLTLAIIALNAIWIAVDTDYNDGAVLLESMVTFQMAENLFCAYFSFEWVARYCSFARKRDGLKDAWFCFDSMLVITMVLETWVMTVVMIASPGGGSSGGMGNAGIMRLARLLRLSRMARMARLLRAMPELMVLIKGMLAATRSVFFTLCLLVMIIYVFAIAFTQLCDGSSSGNAFFGTVPASMYTLLIHGALLDDVKTIATDLGADSYVFVALFFVFCLLAALTVMNMLIGVLCEVVSAVAATEKEEMLVSYVNEKLKQVLDLLDSDSDGKISKKEFVQILENGDAARALQEVGVDVIGLIDFADFIFEKDDDDDANEQEKELSFGDFMEVVLQLRGTNNATVKDIVDLRKFLVKSFTGLSTQIKDLRLESKAALARAAGTVSATGSNHVLSPPCLPPSRAASKTKTAPSEGKPFRSDFDVSMVEADLPVAPMHPLATPAAELMSSAESVMASLTDNAGMNGWSLPEGEWVPLEGESSPFQATPKVPTDDISKEGVMKSELGKNSDAKNVLPDKASAATLHSGMTELSQLRGKIQRANQALSSGMREFHSLQEWLLQEPVRSNGHTSHSDWLTHSASVAHSGNNMNAAFSDTLRSGVQTYESHAPLLSPALSSSEMWHADSFKVAQPLLPDGKSQQL